MPATHDADGYQIEGFDYMDLANVHGWEELPLWGGTEGWELGEWPYMVYFSRHDATGWALGRNTEGDLDTWGPFATRRELFEEITRHAIAEWKLHDLEGPGHKYTLNAKGCLIPYALRRPVDWTPANERQLINN